MIQLPAHALNRIAECNGSIYQDKPEADQQHEQSNDRREGIAAHWVAMEVISGRFSDPIEFVDRKAINGVFVTVEMAEHVDAFVSDVLSRGATTHIEETVDFQMSETVRIACRLDLATFDHATQTLIVDDYKHGYRIVEPENNWQLVAGAMGWMIKYQIAPARIILNIHQPRPQHPDGKKRSWVFNTYAEFIENAYKVMTNKLSVITDNLHTGLHCYRCPSLATCTPARQAGYNLIDMAGTVFNDRLTNDELSQELLNIKRGIKMAEQLEAAYEELLTHRIGSAQVVKDWFVEPQYANTRFKKGTTPEMIKALSGIDCAKTSLPTPAQVKKLRVNEFIINAFTERPMTGQKLVHKSADKMAGKMFKSPTEKD